MILIFRILTLAVVCTLFASCVKPTGGDYSITNSSIPTKKDLPESLPTLPHIGSTAELGKDKTCEKYGDILAYAKTIRFRIYVCGDERSNKPKSMIVENLARNSSKTVIEDNPSISWNKSFVFGSKDFGFVLQKPSAYLPFGSGSSNPPSPKFYSFVRFVEESFINEKINTYLFNEKAIPNYMKVLLEPDKVAIEKFQGLYPNFDKKFKICNLRENNQPKRIEAYEIDRKKYLVEIVCFGTGYNTDYKYVLYSEELSSQQLKIIPINTIALPELGKIQLSEQSGISGIAQFFPEDNTLRVFSKGRGISGCGSAAEYKLIGERFELQEFRLQKCSDVYLSPEEFPKIYP